MQAPGGIAGKGYNRSQITIIVVCSVLYFISFVATALRLLARYLTKTWWWWDDTLCLLATAASWVVNAFTITCTAYGLGRHTSEIAPSDMSNFGLFYWLQELAWCFSMWFVIGSIMWFYLRLFPLRWVVIAFWTISAVTTAWLIMSVLALIFQCKPVQCFWDRQIPDGQCIDLVAFYFTNSAISMITLITTLCLPLPIIFRLQISKVKKVGLGVALSLGVFVCGISAFRLYAIYQVEQEDLAWTSTGSLLWSAIESNVAVVSACIPSMVPVLLIALGRKHSLLSSSMPPTTTANGTVSHVHRTQDYFDARLQSESVKALVTARYQESVDSARPAILSQSHPEHGIRVTREFELTRKPRSQDSVLQQDGLQPSYALR